VPLLWLPLVLGCVDRPYPPDPESSSTFETGVTDSDPSTTEPGETGGDTSDTARDTAPVDADGDGFTAEVDCDDASELVYPGARELCDGLDNNCDGIDDTLGYWPLDDGTGAIAVDAGPLGLDGDLTGGTWTTDGVRGGALEFDGSGTYITLDHGALGPMVGFTLSAWVRPQSLHSGSWDTVISRGAASASEMSCCRDSYFLGYYLYGLSFYTDTPADQTPLLDAGPYDDHVGDWHHLVATWDPGTGRRAIYLDGVQTAEDDLGPPTAFYDGTPTRIGADTNSGSYTLPFHGTMDEVKVFGCAITAEEAARDHAEGWPF